MLTKIRNKRGWKDCLFSDCLKIVDNNIDKNSYEQQKK